MIAGVCIDPWKLEIFKKHLDAAGYKYTVHPGDQVTVLKVETDYAHKLQPVIEAAQEECAKEHKKMTPDVLAGLFQHKATLAAAHGIIRGLDAQFLEGKGNHKDILHCECEVGLYFKLLDQQVRGMQAL